MLSQLVDVLMPLYKLVPQQLAAIAHAIVQMFGCRPDQRSTCSLLLCEIQHFTDGSDIKQMICATMLSEVDIVLKTGYIFSPGYYPLPTPPLQLRWARRLPWQLRFTLSDRPRERPPAHQHTAYRRVITSQRDASCR